MGFYEYDSGTHKRGDIGFWYVALIIFYAFISVKSLTKIYKPTELKKKKSLHQNLFILYHK